MAVTTPEGEAPRLPRAALRAAVRTLRRGCDDLRALSGELGGGVVGEFEEAFGGLVGARHAVACSSGTSALLAALLACGVRPGDEVIVASYGWGGTVGAILTLGASPVFADVHPNTFNLDPARVRKRISSRTVAILATHLFGHPADVVQLAYIARDHGLRLIYDAAQALGATFQGRPMGAWGDVAIFSFGRGKLLSTGEGGMAVTNDPEIHDRLLLASQHPARGRVELCDPFLEPLLNEMSLSSRMHPVAAAIGLAQVQELPARVAKRRKTCLALAAQLRDARLFVAPSEAPGVEHAFHRFVLRMSATSSSDRSVLLAKLREQGVPVVAGPVRVPIHRRRWLPDIHPTGLAASPLEEALPISCQLCEAEEVLLESASDWLAVPPSRLAEIAGAFRRLAESMVTDRTATSSPLFLAPGQGADTPSSPRISSHFRREPSGEPRNDR